WAYYMGQQEVKPAAELIGYVQKSKARNAACWINVGPTPEGEILAAEAAELRQVGAWMRTNRATLR
ncbi:MAG TPA: alpha-L-fucosidase, partial [Phototrophicaceae bacterium]|nr:alpha-L-fucosidase [Phototrophicaceae bacterium]